MTLTMSDRKAMILSASIAGAGALILAAALLLPPVIDLVRGNPADAPTALFAPPAPKDLGTSFLAYERFDQHPQIGLSPLQGFERPTPGLLPITPLPPPTATASADADDQ